MLLTLAVPLLMLLSVGCTAQPFDAPAPAPVPAPTTTTNDPPPEAARGDAKLTTGASLDQILDALDRRGDDLRSLAADVTLTETDAALGDEVTRTGSFALELRPDGSARSRITFNDKVANNRKTKEKIEYLLDGPNLIDRTYRTKTQVTRQVLRPGERINLLKLGEGPFPLPIGQDKEEVRRLFEVTKVEPDAELDPPNTVHVKLVPKPDTPFANQFKSIDAWVDLTDHMPKRIETVDANGVTVRTTDLSNVRVNAKLDDSAFALEKLPEGWTLLNEAYDRR
jgi:outer membrane lipoprotein-sorting protein